MLPSIVDNVFKTGPDLRRRQAGLRIYGAEIIANHPRESHIGGADNHLNDIPVRQILDSGQMDSGPQRSKSNCTRYRFRKTR